MGYDLDKENHKLIINPTEAKLVQEIFDAYLKEKTLTAATKAINRKGYVSKRIESSKGNKRGGIKFKSTTINQIIKNPYYLGKVRHDNVLYTGEQERIISDEIFANVQELLTANRRVFNLTPKHAKIGLLSHILRCKACNSTMFIAYTEKNGKLRYYHYVCLGAHKRSYSSCPTKLVNANLMNNKVVDCLRSITDDPRIKDEEWNNLGLDHKIPIIRSIVKEIRYDGATEALEIQLHDDKVYSYKVPKQELKYLPVTPKERLIRQEPQLRQNLLLAHQIQGLLSEGKSDNIKQIAGWLNISPQRINQLRNFVLLCPKIQEEIFLGDNKTISDIPEYKLRQISDAIDWQEQEKLWQELLSTLSK